VPQAPTCAFLPRSTPRRRARTRLAMRLATVAVTARPPLGGRARVGRRANQGASRRGRGDLGS
jgi:hypothetical protein